MGSDLFLSTNESSNIISSQFAAAGNAGHLSASHGGAPSAPIPLGVTKGPSSAFPAKKPRAAEGWKHYENKIIMNVSGQSGEKIEVVPKVESQAALVSNPAHARADRAGLSTSSALSRPGLLSKNLNQMSNKRETTLQQLRNTFYSNNHSQCPSGRIASTTLSRVPPPAVGVGGLAGEKRMHQQLLEIKKPNISDIKKKE